MRISDWSSDVCSSDLWPPYFSLLENCLTNATLPSISFGRHSCSQKWKIQPQDQRVKEWEPAQRIWAQGGKVVKLIGYDSSPADSRRYAHREGHIRSEERRVGKEGVSTCRSRW